MCPDCFIGPEDERFVLDDRSTNAAAKLVQAQTSLRRGSTSHRIGCGIEKVPSVKSVVTLEIVSGTVHIVGSRFDAQINDGPRLPSVFRRRVFLCVKFLNCVNGEDTPRSPLDAFRVYYSRSVVRIVVIRAVDDEIVVLRTVPVRADRKKATASCSLHSGPQDDEILKVAAVQRQIVYGFVCKRSAKRVIGSFHQRELLRHSDRFRYAAGLHRNVEADIFRHFQPDAAALDFLEPCRLNDQLVGARRQAGSDIVSRVVGFERSRDSRVHIGDGQVRAFDKASTLVRHGAQNAAFLRLPGRNA